MNKSNFRPKLLSLLIVSCAAHGQAHAETKLLEEALSKCLVLKSTGQDRLNLARWIGGALLSTPQLADVGILNPVKKEETDKAVAAVFTRLLTKDCLPEARLLLKTSDSSAFERASEAFGAIAIDELMSNKEADAAMGSFAKYLKDDDFRTLSAP